VNNTNKIQLIKLLGENGFEVEGIQDDDSFGSSTVRTIAELESNKRWNRVVLTVYKTQGVE